MDVTQEIPTVYVAFTDFVYMIQCIYCLMQVSLVGIIGAWICERILDPFCKRASIS